MTDKYIQGKHLEQPLTVLCDSGATNTMVNDQCLPFGTVPDIGAFRSTTTTNGTFNTSRTVSSKGIQFPEFANRKIRDFKVDVFHSPNCRYDMIIGRSELSAMGINFDYQAHTVTWLKQSIPMKSTTSFSAIPESLFEEQ